MRAQKIQDLRRHRPIFRKRKYASSRSSCCTKLGPVLSVVARTNSTIAFLAAPSFHEGSLCVTACLPKGRLAAIASTEANSRRTYDFVDFMAPRFFGNLKSNGRGTARLRRHPL